MPYLFFILLLILSGCQNNTPSSAEVQKDTTSDVMNLCRKGVIEYEIKTIKEVAVNPSDRSDLLAETHIKYPELHCANKKLEKSVKIHISQFVENLLKANMNVEDTARAKTMRTAARAFIRSCRSNILDQRKTDPGSDEVWYADITGNVEMQSNEYFTIRFRYDTYTGGAHGTYGESYKTFRIESGEPLTWKNILSDSNAFLRLAEKRFKQVNGLAPGQKLSEEEGFFFDKSAFFLPDNFGLTNDGLVVYYEPYLVAPYSFGATSLLFKYMEISEMLNPALFETQN